MICTENKQLGEATAKTIILTLIFSAIIVGVLIHEGTDPKRIGIKVCGGTLRYVFSNWKSDGSPSEIDIGTYIKKSSDRYFVFTNVYHIRGKICRCLFAVESPRFRGDGILAITSENELLWIDSGGRAKILEVGTTNIVDK